MGLTSPHIVTHRQKFFAMLEAAATPGVFVKPTTADGIAVISTDFSPKEVEDPRDDISEGWTHYEYIRQKLLVDASVEMYVVPSGTAGTAPESDLLHRAFWGDGTNVPATSETYNMPTTQELETLSLVRMFGPEDAIKYEAITGFVPNEYKIVFSGGDPPKITYSGRAMGWFGCGASLVASDAASDNTFIVTAGDGAGFTDPPSTHTSWGAVIEIDGVVTDRQITDVSTDTIIVDGAVFQATGAEKVRPWTPAYTKVGSPLAHTLGFLEFDDVDIPTITGAEVTVTHNHEFVDDEAFADSMSDAIRGKMLISGKISVRGRQDMVIDFFKRKRFEDRKIELQAGTTAGAIMLTNLPQTRFMVDKLTVGAQVGTYDIPFTAQDSAENANDAINTVWK
jgi:hypothetical protein